MPVPGPESYKSDKKGWFFSIKSPYQKERKEKIYLASMQFTEETCKPLLQFWTVKISAVDNTEHQGQARVGKPYPTPGVNEHNMDSR